MEEKIKQMLLDTGRPGIENLIKAMDEGGFFTAPCSGAYHLCKEGGLAEHSMNVYNTLIQLNDSLEAGLNEKSMILVALLHDLGKMGDHGKPNYVANYVRSKTKNKETGEYDMVISSAKPFTTNKELIYEEHEIRSVIIASRCIHLTEEEEHAILHHNAMWGKLDSPFSCSFDNTKLSLLLHMADLWCSRFVEVEKTEEE